MLYRELSRIFGKCELATDEMEFSFIPVDIFRMICRGDHIGKSGKPLHYKGSSVHRVIPDFMLQGQLHTSILLDDTC